MIVSPALAEANNGNWRTAHRWARWLSDDHRVRTVREWPDAHAAGDSVMLALHARRSAGSIAGWARLHPQRGLAVVLTGTDLYRDIAVDADADSLHSLAVATRLVVLQPMAIAALPPEMRSKACVILQSVSSRAPLTKPNHRLLAVMVGHLRDVKSPRTLMDAARLLPSASGIAIRHIGAAQEPLWADAARAAENDCAAYRWLGELPHPRTRDWIQRAHVLVHTSAMEGGAHVIIEAVCSGTPVVASRVDGNVGLLGEGYAGYFEHGDAAGLARLLIRCREEQTSKTPADGLLQRLRAQCAERAPLFSPMAERDALRSLVAQLAAQLAAHPARDAPPDHLEQT